VADLRYESPAILFILIVEPSVGFPAEGSTLFTLGTESEIKLARISLLKSSILRSAARKELLRCNHGELVTAKSSTLKKFRKFESRRQFFAGLFSTNNRNSHFRLLL
jgi:hypothetical protein